VSEHENAIDYGDGSFLRRTGSVEIQSFAQDTSSTKRLGRRKKLHRSRTV